MEFGDSCFQVRAFKILPSLKLRIIETNPVGF